MSTEISRDGAKLTGRATRLKVATDGRLLFYGWVRARPQGMVSHADVLRVDSQVAAS
jgi:hypothetical protein